MIELFSIYKHVIVQKILIQDNVIIIHLKSSH